MIFPQFLIDETKKQTERDLTRFDLDYDLPDHFLPEFPAPTYLATRMDLGDVSQGKLVTLGNFDELFKDIVNPKLDPAQASESEMRGQGIPSARAGARPATPHRITPTTSCTP